MATERVDEGRWESEGGQPVHKLTTEKSPDTPISELAKPDTASSATSTTSTATTETAPSSAASTASASEYDAGKVHPKTIEGAAGDSSQSHYPDTASTASTDASVASSTSSSSTEADAQGGLQADATAPARKKSISERLAETWQDIKHKVEDLTNKKGEKAAEK